MARQRSFLTLVAAILLLHGPIGTGTAGASQLQVVGSGIAYSYDGSSWRLNSGQEMFQVETLGGVWGGSEDDIFIVGSGGAVAHYDGSVWSDMESGTLEDLYDVFGISSNDIFAVGRNGTILHYDGTGWQAMDSKTSNTLYAVWGSSGSDVFVVGINHILHYNGSMWSMMDLAPALESGGYYLSVWGSSGSDVFAGGLYDSGDYYFIHYDGDSWSLMTDPMPTAIKDIWGASGTDIFACGPDYMMHYDGTGWTATSMGLYEDRIECITGLSGSDVFVGAGGGKIYHYDGVTWTSEDTEAGDLLGIYAVSDTCIITVGTGGSVWRFSGASWSEELEKFPFLRDVWGTSASDLYAAGYERSGDGDGVIMRYDGTCWTEELLVPDVRFYCIWGSSGNDIYAAGDYLMASYYGRIYHYDGMSWSLVHETGAAIYDLWGTDFYDVYAGGYYGNVYHFNYSEWSQVRENQYVPDPGWFGSDRIEAGWSSSVGDIWVAGGDTREPEPPPYSSFYDTDPFIQRCLHSNWQEKIYLPEPFDSDNLSCRGIWGAPSGGLFVTTGWYEPVFIYENFSWTRIDSVDGTDVWGASGSEVYVLGSGSVFHYDGSVWAGMDLNSPNLLYAIWGDTTTAPTGSQAPPAPFVLEQNYPNPFNPVTTISFSLPVRGRVTLTVYDVTGARVARIVDEVLDAGTHVARWKGLNSRGREAASGVYFYRLEACGLEETRKMVLLH